VLLDTRALDGHLGRHGDGELPRLHSGSDGSAHGSAELGGSHRPRVVAVADLDSG
jgi:hypothetical protein